MCATEPHWNQDKSLKNKNIKTEYSRRKTVIRKKGGKKRERERDGI